MDVKRPSALLGGLSPMAFMRRHWQKAPLLVRAARGSGTPVLSRAALFALAGRDDVESRLVERDAGRWQVRHGPFVRRGLPPLAQPGWTLLVQGIDLQVAAARRLLDGFRFVPEVRLDDVMVSWASPGGGVGAHVDSYDVFLLQLQGRRRWRIGPAEDRSFRPGLPLKILRRFAPTESWLLEPGDMLYVPPGWGHDGVAVGGDCMTASIGYRAPQPGAERLYADAAQAATATPGAIPPPLLRFARDAVEKLLRQPLALERALGEVLTEPKPTVWFAAGVPWKPGAAIEVAPATRLAYDARHVFINGESFRAAGTDRRLLVALADERRLDGPDAGRFSTGARRLIDDWHRQGWLVPVATLKQEQEAS
jgi:50S ribosomal protein L16 3-hydroxylase